MKIVVCSDNHTFANLINLILELEPDGDYYWHLGDSESFDISQLGPFASVFGNNDFLYDLPEKRIIELYGHSFLLTHGSKQLRYGLENLAQFGKDNKCDVVLFGHTHMPFDNVVNGIRMINPGSCFHNRGGEKPSYCVLELTNDGTIKCTFKYIDNDKKDNL